MEELKVRSFRISEEVSAKLKELCEDFDNQNSALSALINAYEVQNAKATLIDRQTDISDYDTHIQAIQSAFLRSLEINENAEKRIKISIEQGGRAPLDSPVVAATFSFFSRFFPSTYLLFLCVARRKISCIWRLFIIPTESFTS